MTAEHAHHPSGPLAVAVGLAVVAGYLDAYLFLFVTNVFVANMSGNMIRIGIFAGDGSWTTTAASAAALGAFMTGVVVAILHHDRRLQRGASVRPDELLFAEAALMFSLPIMLYGFDLGFATNPGPAHYLVIGVAAMAMGMQASALRRVGEIAVATTYGTGTVVRVGEKIALALRKAERVSDHRRLYTILVLFVVLVGYIGGAAIASALGSAHWLLGFPPAMLIGLALFVRHDQQIQSLFAASRSRFSTRQADDF